MAFVDKAKKIFKKRAFLFTLLLSIVGFICVPLIALQIILIGRSTDEFQKNNQEYYSSVLQACANSFSSQESILSKIALQISLDEAVQKPLRHNATEYSLFTASEALKNYGTEVLHAQQAGVYYIVNEYMLIDGVKYTVEEFCAKYVPVDDAAAAGMHAFFRQLQGMDYFTISDSGILIAATPISLISAGQNDAVAFFLIDADALAQSYCTSISYHASFAIMDHNRRFLVQGEDFRTEINSDTLSECLNFQNTSCTTDSNKELLLYRYTDPETNLQYLLLLDKGESEQRLVDFSRQARIIMFFALVVVCLSLTATLYINYRPIHLLLKKHLPKTDSRGIHSELELLDSAFFALDERMSTQQNLLMDSILGDLLFGNAVDQEKVRQYIPDNRYQNFIVVSAQHAAVTAAQTKELTDLIEERSACRTHITRIPYRPHIIIICLSEGVIEPNHLKGIIATSFTDVLKEDCLISMGDVVTDFCSLRASYRSSLTANPDQALDHAELDNVAFSKECQEFVQCVYVGDEEEALLHLSKAEAFIYTDVPSDALRRYYGYKLIHTYLMGINHEAYLSKKDIDLILSFRELRHLFVLLRDSVRQVCEQVADTERSVDIQLQQQLLRYVDDNFCNSGLCLTSAADYLNTSIYVISRLFKEVTGRGFKDYVTGKRLEYGHMLLCTTQQSITEISATAGFENANYFSTVFKMKYGLPPTKYRRMMAEKHKAD